MKKIVFALTLISASFLSSCHKGAKIIQINKNEFGVTLPLVGTAFEDSHYVELEADSIYYDKEKVAVIAFLDNQITSYSIDNRISVDWVKKDNENQVIFMSIAGPNKENLCFIAEKELFGKRVKLTEFNGRTIFNYE